MHHSHFFVGQKQVLMEDEAGAAGVLLLQGFKKSVNSVEFGRHEQL